MIELKEIAQALEDIESYYEFTSTPVEANINGKATLVIGLRLLDEITVTFHCLHLKASEVLEVFPLPKGQIEDHQIYDADYDIIMEEDDLRELFQHFHDSYWNLFKTDNEPEILIADNT